MKAIETEYNGYKFRSRLEARWAVFFDAFSFCDAELRKALRKARQARFEWGECP